MARIVVIGAGSLVFASRLTIDILSVPELAGSTLVYVDIDPKALALIRSFAEQVIAQHKLPAQVITTTNRREALAGADYVITTFRVGGAQATSADLRIPLKYGIDQSVGDTIGVGGIFYGQAHIRLMIEICRDMEDLCPDAWLLNHTNPMAMLCWAVNQATGIKNVGLCHSVQHTSEQLAGHIGAPYAEVDYWVAGINHMAWFLKFTWQGKDAYPLLRQRLAAWDAANGDAGLAVENHPENPYYGNDPWTWDTVRRELFRQFGYYVTESTAHLSEYLPYFRRTPELLARYALKGQNMDAFAKRWESRRTQQNERLNRQAAGTESIALDRTTEYSSSIIESIETGRICRVNVNVRNTGLITNLPADCVVEVPCLVDRLGVHPCHVGNLPPQLAALNRTNIHVQELAVKAALEQDRAALYQAVALDPLASSKLSFAEIHNLVDEMVEALQPWLPEYR